MCREDCPFRFKSFYGHYFCNISIDFFGTTKICPRISDSLCQYMRFQYSQFFNSENNKDNDSSETN